MEFTLENIENNRAFFEEKGYKLPMFDIFATREQTKKFPCWIHFGAGNIFRAFPAVICQNLLNKGLISTGIVTAEGYDYEIVEKCMKKFDNLTLNITLNSDGSVEKEVIASVTESLCMDNENERDMNRLREIFKAESLKIASFTITEKGYNLKDKDGNFFKSVEKDFGNSPLVAESYMGKIASLCFERFKHNKLPLTLLSLDNCSHNGTKLEKTVLQFAEKWAENGFVENEFVNYIKTEISFPWSMIDKITPRPSEKVLEILKKDGLENVEPFVTAKNTYIAPFVNGEKTEYLVIENDFKNGKIPLDVGEKKGVIFTDKMTVDKAEKMKVCTCLNPLHTALAIFGCLLSYTKISDEMKNENLVKFITEMSIGEGLPVVVDPKIIEPEKFLKEVIEIRFPNDFMPDSPQRIACDTSQKLSIRFGETIKAYINSDELEVGNLKFIPLVIAGWIRYLTGYDDYGNKFELSPDPYIELLKPLVDNLEFGKTENSRDVVFAIISNENIFGLDLTKTSLAEKIVGYFNELNSGKGAVGKTIEKYTSL